VPDLEVALFVAPSPVPTEEARAALPARVEHADAVFNLARVASFVQVLHTRQWPLLDLALEDRLHLSYRMPLYPWVQEVINAAREAGAYGASVAGAGPSVFAFCERRLGDDVAAAMEEAGLEEGYGLVTRVTRSGLDVRG
jgi:homoserine kinase